MTAAQASAATHIERIRIVLSHTSHPGNIGAAARAMKTMGLSRLVLVRPKDFPHAQADAMAAGATDLLVQSAVVGRTVDSNEEVVAFVERAAGSSLDSATLRAHLREHLAPYKIPGEIRFLAILPAAPTGKLLKGVMKTMAQQPADAGGPPL